MNIKRMDARITGVRDLSATAREVTLALPDTLGFLPGAFINVFVPQEGKPVRRAYSIASNETNQSEVSLAIRRSSATSVSSFFWNDDVVSRPLQIMGPLGLNTIDKIEHARVFLFGFGIGVSVIKSLAEHLASNGHIRELWILTGSRTEDEILYKAFFEELASQHPRVHVRFVVSRPTDAAYPYVGHLQQHIADLDFTDATVYTCGQLRAAKDLEIEILKGGFTQTQFLTEAFDG